MARRPRLLSFFRIPLRLQVLALEAGAELLRARLATLRAASHYTRLLGAASDNNRTADAAPQQEHDAAEIGAVVERVARWMPFRALCLQQAIATRRMLARRGLPAVVYLGLALDAHARSSGNESAHAWVRTGGRVVIGDTDLDRFAVVGTFG